RRVGSYGALDTCRRLHGVQEVNAAGMVGLAPYLVARPAPALSLPVFVLPGDDSAGCWQRCSCSTSVMPRSSDSLRELSATRGRETPGWGVDRDLDRFSVPDCPSVVGPMQISVRRH